MTAAVEIADAPSTALGAPPCPYPGLRPFTEHSAHLFFGRDQQRDECVRRLQANRFLAVVGMSGAGKSSLVRAGIIPVLRMGLLADSSMRLLADSSKPWRIATMRPGRHPRDALARALAKEFNAEGASVAGIAGTLSRSSRGLIDAVAELGGRKSNLLLVVDQFEELFRLGRDLEGSAARKAEKSSFVDLLLAPRSQVDLPIYVVITMRSDFLGHCATYYDLPDTLNQGQFLVPRLSRLQLEHAIASPAEVTGLNLSHALVQRVLDDATNLPDELPVVQHALMRTYQLWLKDVTPGAAWDKEMTVGHYELAGTVERALSLHGEEAFGKLDKDGKRSAEIMFRRITRSRGALPDEDIATASATRDPAPRSVISELVRKEGVSNPDAALEQAILAFRDPGDLSGDDSEEFESGACRFLMRTNQETTEDLSDEEMDITHEAILRKWSKLAKWIDSEEADATSYRKLQNIAGSVEQPLSGKDLKPFAEWWARRKPTAEWARRYQDLASLTSTVAGGSNDIEGPRIEVERTSEALLRLRLDAFEATKAYLERCLAKEKRALRNRRWRSAGAVLGALLSVAGVIWSVGNSYLTSEKDRLEGEARRGRFSMLTGLTLSDKERAWSELRDTDLANPDVQRALNGFLAKRLEKLTAKAKELESRGCPEEEAVLYEYARAAAGAPGDERLDNVARLFERVVATAPLSAPSENGACLRSVSPTCERMQALSGGLFVASCGGAVGAWRYAAAASASAADLLKLVKMPKSSESGEVARFAGVETAAGPLFLLAQERAGKSPAGASFFLENDGGERLEATIPGCVRPDGLAAESSAPNGIRAAVLCDSKVLACSIADPVGWRKMLEASQAPKNAFGSMRVNTFTRALQHISSVAWLGPQLALGMQDGLALVSSAGVARYADSTKGYQVFSVRAFSDTTAQAVAYGTVQNSAHQARVGIIGTEATEIAPPVELERTQLERFRVVSIAGAKSPHELAVLAIGKDPASKKDVQKTFLVQKGTAKPLALAAAGAQPEAVGDIAATAESGAFVLAVALPGRVRFFAFPDTETGEQKEDRWQHVQKATGLTVDDETLELRTLHEGHPAGIRPWAAHFPRPKSQPAAAASRN